MHIEEQMTSRRILHDAATPQGIERCRDSFSPRNDHLRELLLCQVGSDFNQLSRRTSEFIRKPS